MVTAGTFLVDSESRLKSGQPTRKGTAASKMRRRNPTRASGVAISAAKVKDAACGMMIDAAKAVCRGQHPHSRWCYVLLLLGSLQAEVQRAAGALSGRESLRARVMINRIIDFSVKHKLLVLASAAVACIFGWWAMMSLPLDATPDLSETQVIIYSRWDRSPDIVEDQVTYPIVTAMLGAPKVKTVRGVSDFGYSYVYVIFEDGTDLYWARSRALEYLSSVQSRLPEGVKTELGPDATALGWVYQYALVDTSGKHSLADLRSYQDWYLRYYLHAVPGVAEVAPVGGYTRQYQVNVDPNRLQAYGIPIRRVVEAVRSGNEEVGGRLARIRRHRVHGPRPRLCHLDRGIQEHRP